MAETRDSLAISLFSEVLTLEHLIRGRIGRALPKGMELSHFIVLNHLAHVADERRPGQLAEALNLTRGAMTNTLTKLEVAGHVHIRPDWDDARRKLVSISSAGRQARDAALAAVSPILGGASSEVQIEDLRRTMPTLRALRRNLAGKD